MAIIETRRLSKIYGTGETAVTALTEMNLKIEQGEFIAVMGPSGCGKSTLLHMLGGLDYPTSGEVFIEGKNIATLDDDALTAIRRNKIGFVFQYFNLIPVLGALDNAALPLILEGVDESKAMQVAKEWLEKLGLGDKLTKKPDQLSGGQQQRVAIARALSSNPALILADEPTGNLDSKTTDEVIGILRKVATDWGKTILMVTHDSRVAAHADRIVFLKDGTIVDETRLTVRDGSSGSAIREKVDLL